MLENLNELKSGNITSGKPLDTALSANAPLLMLMSLSSPRPATGTRPVRGFSGVNGFGGRKGIFAQPVRHVNSYYWRLTFILGYGTFRTCMKSLSTIWADINGLRHSLTSSKIGSVCGR